jgi:hypothetical protein
MNETLANITPPGPFSFVVFSLVNWADQNGRDVELIHAMGKDRPRNAKVQQMYKKYGMAIAVDVKGVSATATDSADGGLEKIVKPHLSLPDFGLWREKMTSVESRVCRITLNNNAQGTGFLVGPEAVLTNYHVMQPVIDGDVPAKAVQCEFDFKLLTDGTTPLTAVGLADDWLLDHSPYSESEAKGTPEKIAPTADELDYALIRLAVPFGSQPWAKSPGSMAPSRGWIYLAADATAIPETMPIIIAQHPRGLPMKLAIDTAGVDKSKGLWLNAAKNRLRYATNTEGGSSGSPCFDFNWRLVALHHYGDPAFGHAPAYNQGVPISVVKSRLAKKPTALAALGGDSN